MNEINLKSTYLDTRELNDNQKIDVYVQFKYKTAVQYAVFCIKNYTQYLECKIYNTPSIRDNIINYDLDMSILEGILSDNNNIINLYDVLYCVKQGEKTQLNVDTTLTPNNYELEHHIFEITEDINIITELEIEILDIILVTDD